MIKLDSVTRDFTRPDGTVFRAVEQVSLVADAGEVIGLVGPSGCGKSTILNIVAGLIRPSSGTAWVDGDDPAQLKGSGKVAYVFQQPRLLPWRTVEDNIRFALLPLGIDEAEVEARVTRFLDIVDLGDFRQAFPGTLSGGMRQRVAVARAFATGANNLLMDEPFASVDELTARMLRRELESLLTSLSPTVLFVTHNISEAVFLADKVIALSPRPARIVDVVEIPLERPRDPESPEAALLQRRLLAAMGLE